MSVNVIVLLLVKDFINLFFQCDYNLTRIVAAKIFMCIMEKNRKTTREKYRNDGKLQ